MPVVNSPPDAADNLKAALGYFLESCRTLDFLGTNFYDLDMGLFDKFKGKLVEAEVDETETRAALPQTVGDMWDWLRRSLDAGCEIYLKTGSPEHLQACLTDRAYDDVIAYLDQLRAHNIIWVFPERDSQAQTRVRVEEVIGENIYIVSEYFRDYSRLEFYQHDRIADVREADGSEKVLRATIQTDNEGNYYISEVALQSAL